MKLWKGVSLVLVTALVTLAVLYPVFGYSLRLNYPFKGIHQARLLKQCVVVVYEPTV